MACTRMTNFFKEVATFKFWRDCMLEFFMNVVLLFLGTAVALKTSDYKSPLEVVPIGIVGGGIVFCMIEAFGHIDGAHINPVITVLFMLSKNVSVIKGLVFIVFEAVGAYTGIILFSVCIRKDMRDLITPVQPSPGIEPYQVVILECLLTTVLSSVTLGVLDQKRRKVNMPGLMIGFTIIIGVFAGAQYGGGCIHPGVAFGPAAYSGIWRHQWVYWVGPILGAPVGWMAYMLFIWEGDRCCKSGKESEVDVDEKGELMEVTTA